MYGFIHAEWEARMQETHYSACLRIHVLDKLLSMYEDTRDLSRTIQSFKRMTAINQMYNAMHE